MLLLSFILSTELMLGPCFSVQWVWFFIWNLPESLTVLSHDPVCIHVITALTFLKHIKFFLAHYFSVPNVLPDFSSRWFLFLPRHLLKCLLFVHTGCTFCYFFGRSFSFLGSGTLVLALQILVPSMSRILHVQNTCWKDGVLILHLSAVLELYLHVFSIGRM